MGILSGLFRSRDKPQNRTVGDSFAFFMGGSTSGRDGHTVEKKWKDHSRKQSWTSEMRERARQREVERRMQNAEIYNGNPCN